VFVVARAARGIMKKHNTTARVRRSIANLGTRALITYAMIGKEIKRVRIWVS
jgi:hypothetical protein